MARLTLATVSSSLSIALLIIERDSLECKQMHKLAEICVDATRFIPMNVTMEKDLSYQYTAHYPRSALNLRARRASSEGARLVLCTRIAQSISRVLDGNRAQSPS